MKADDTADVGIDARAPAAIVHRMETPAAISNLVFTYAELIDAGDFQRLAELFAHAEFTSEGDPVIRRGTEQVLALYERFTRRYEDGTPKTKHVTTNLLIEVDDQAGTATSRSYFTVLQAVPGELALQPIVAGRYRDGFERVDGAWRFSARHIIIDLMGDLSHHMMQELPT
jgi:3-phenylpropionate/cinnamic acid dioxygenase small subunit